MFFAPTDSQNQEVVSFSVKSGSSLSAVSKNLEAAGLIHNHTVFKYMADFMGMGQKIQSGDYELTRAMSATEILGSADFRRRKAADDEDNNHPGLDGRGCCQLSG